MLNETERTLLSMILAGEHPVLATLRAQAETVTVLNRDFSAVGVNISLAVAADARPAEPRSFDLGDVAFQFQGAENSGHLVLMVRDGILRELMAYNWTDDWPKQPALAWVKYLSPNPRFATANPSDSRDMAGLAKELAA